MKVKPTIDFILTQKCNVVIYQGIRWEESTNRAGMSKSDAEFEKMIAGGGSAVAYAWYVWQKGFNGTTELKWFN